jgi:hypothetical protein
LKIGERLDEVLLPQPVGLLGLLDLKKEPPAVAILEGPELLKRRRFLVAPEELS